MDSKPLDALFAQYRNELSREQAREAREMARFLEFLMRHGGLKKLDIPGKDPRPLESAQALRCFHFSQYLDWYLTEKITASAREVEDARLAMGHFNEWLLERQAITQEVFEENRDSILSGEAGPAVYEDVSGRDEDEEEPLLSAVREEKDFYVPGEYSATLSGELILTQVQEGILYGRFPDGGKEIGPILVDRAVSSSHKVGDRVHLALGKAGGHWNLLSEGLKRDGST